MCFVFFLWSSGRGSSDTVFPQYANICCTRSSWMQIAVFFFGLEAGESCDFSGQTYVAASSFSATLTKYASVRRTISDSDL